MVQNQKTLEINLKKSISLNYLIMITIKVNKKPKDKIVIELDNLNKTIPQETFTNAMFTKPKLAIKALKYYIWMYESCFERK